jgi:hypothetical protein
MLDGVRRVIVLFSLALALAPSSAQSQGATVLRVVSGTVRDVGTGFGLGSVSIQLVDNAGRGIASATTDSSGKYRVYPPASGGYRLRAQRIGYLRLESALMRVDSAPKVVDLQMVRGATLDSMLVVAASDVRPLRVTQQLIRGRLLDDDTRQPLDNGTIELQDAKGKVVVEAPTDRNGLFRLVTPSPGTYSLRGKRIGYTPAQQTGLRLKLGDTVRVDFHLARNAALLSPVLVTESAKPWDGRHESNREAQLYARMARFGKTKLAQFIPRETIDLWDSRQRTMGEMMDRVVIPGIPRGPECRGGAYFVEGFAIGGGYELAEIDLIEVYTFPAIPAEFNQPRRGKSPCRVVSVWLRPTKG